MDIELDARTIQLTDSTLTILRDVSITEGLSVRGYSSIEQLTTRNLNAFLGVITSASITHLDLGETKMVCQTVQRDETLPAGKIITIEVEEELYCSALGEYIGESISSIAVLPTGEDISPSSCYFTEETLTFAGSVIKRMIKNDNDKYEINAVFDVDIPGKSRENILVADEIIHQKTATSEKVISCSVKNGDIIATNYVYPSVWYYQGSGTRTSEEVYTVTGEEKQTQVTAYLKDKRIEEFELNSPYTSRLVSIDKENGSVVLDISGLAAGVIIKATYIYELTIEEVTSRTIYTVTGEEAETQVTVKLETEDTRIFEFELLSPYSSRLVSIDKDIGSVVIDIEDIEASTQIKATYTKWVGQEKNIDIQVIEDHSKKMKIDLTDCPLNKFIHCKYYYAEEGIMSDEVLYQVGEGEEEVTCQVQMKNVVDSAYTSPEAWYYSASTTITSKELYTVTGEEKETGESEEKAVTIVLEDKCIETFSVDGSSATYNPLTSIDKINGIVVLNVYGLSEGTVIKATYTIESTAKIQEISEKELYKITGDEDCSTIEIKLGDEFIDTFNLIGIDESKIVDINKRYGIIVIDISDINNGEVIKATYSNWVGTKKDVPIDEGKTKTNTGELVLDVSGVPKNKFVHCSYNYDNLIVPGAEIRFYYTSPLGGLSSKFPLKVDQAVIGVLNIDDKLQSSNEKKGYSESVAVISNGQIRTNNLYSSDEDYQISRTKHFASDYGEADCSLVELNDLDGLISQNTGIRNNGIAMTQILTGGGINYLWYVRNNQSILYNTVYFGNDFPEDDSYLYQEIKLKESYAFPGAMWYYGISGRQIFFKDIYYQFQKLPSREASTETLEQTIYVAKGQTTWTLTPGSPICVTTDDEGEKVPAAYKIILGDSDRCTAKMSEDCTQVIITFPRAAERGETLSIKLQKPTLITETFSGRDFVNLGQTTEEYVVPSSIIEDNTYALTFLKTKIVPPLGEVTQPTTTFDSTNRKIIINADTRVIGETDSIYLSYYRKGFIDYSGMTGADIYYSFDVTAAYGIAITKEISSTSGETTIPHHYTTENKFSVDLPEYLKTINKSEHPSNMYGRKNLSYNLAYSYISKDHSVPTGAWVEVSCSSLDEHNTINGIYWDTSYTIAGLTDTAKCKVYFQPFSPVSISSFVARINVHIHLQLTPVEGWKANDEQSSN